MPSTKPEPHVITTGLVLGFIILQQIVIFVTFINKRLLNTLGPYFDWSETKTGFFDGWNKVIPLSRAEPRPPPKPSLTANLEVIDVDCAQKMSMATFSKFSPLKYSAAFNTASQVGLKIPVPTSGDIGPGDYPGKYNFLPGTSVKNPEKKSLAFLLASRDPPREKFADPEFKFRSFSEMNQSGIVFQKTGVTLNKNQMRAVAVSKKIRKIYPRLIRSQQR